MFINRLFWQNLIEAAWQKKSIIWLMGVRRVGKTSLCNSISNIEYFDCERPRVRALLADPEDFLALQANKRIILDEVHRLDNPSEILKLAADHYPTVKIIATGSSTLGASTKFKDTLTGRKTEIWLTPLLLSELKLFGNIDLKHRFLYGGLPNFFVQNKLPEDDFKEWIDAYWAKDIQELFKVGKRYSFQKFTELLLAYSGGIFEATKFTAPCEVSRQTIANYLDILEETFVVHVIRPYSSHRATEIVTAPKVYGFDTGFGCYARGWREIRQEDLGLMWEHCILNELHGRLQTRAINYWRDKRGHEIDFVLKNRSDNSLTVIECKFSSTSVIANRAQIAAVANNIQAFRKIYPDGKNFIVSHDIDLPIIKKHDDIELIFINPQDLIEKI
jgi:predicted AAA+ superfamily ATPase